MVKARGAKKVPVTVIFSGFYGENGTKLSSIRD